QHGRVKVKSTAQQEEEKRKEREKKLKLYIAARDACFSKRKEGILDEEALLLTQQLLSSNPDFATLWNYRREILEHLETEKNEDDMQKVYEAELLFLESCLKINPKSYGSWHHRCWVSTRLPRPDWTRELSLCNQCLSLDDRNFHCWDYRRMVVKMSGVPVDQELAYTDRQIGSNFSNYSSWHYRSTLLPLLHPESPDPSSPSDRVCEEQLLKEYELVRNAFFTDPNDQSAWFYYRWLLGRAEREEMISCVYVSREEGRVAVAFSRPVNVRKKMCVNLLLVLDGQPQRVEWRSVHPRLKHSPVWICDLPPGAISDAVNEHNLTVHWTEKRTRRDCALYTGRSQSWCRDSATDQELFRSQLSEKTSVLQSELESCNQLRELEPLNKWCLLTVILLMRALDPLGYEKETLEHFQTLKEVDPMRSAYYSDLCSKFMIENTILKMEYAEVRVFSISDKNLTTLCHLDQLLLVTHISLSSNQLQRLPPQFAMLQCLEVLEADSNNLENLEGVYQLPKLEEVLLRSTEISSLADLQPLASCPKLKHLDLRGNPVTQSDNIEAELAELLPSVTHLLL
uniref:Geranylgeranyl transferase type-2 subunit alpha n=1 Tax=Tetraodon nigroviridis TaxID=99883 RepID=H3DJU0_TETNG